MWYLSAATAAGALAGARLISAVPVVGEVSGSQGRTDGQPTRLAAVFSLRSTLGIGPTHDVRVDRGRTEMSDFDTVLERLLTDRAFAAALAADPSGALARYRLDPEEVALLHSQVGGDSGGQSGVEVRANQSSLFGMLSPLSGLASVFPGFAGSDGGAATGVSGMGPAGAGTGGDPTPVEGASAEVGIGPRDPVRQMGPRADPIQGLGPATGGAGAGDVESTGSSSGLAAALDAAAGGTGPAGTALGGALAGGGPGLPAGEAGFGGAQTGLGGAGAPPAEPRLPDGYRTRVDIDGDGEWDRHEVRARADGGVDIVADTDGDGEIDFVGHDLNADGLVEVAEYDRDGDGHFERRMHDDDGDGWMDRPVRVDPPAAS
jgi:hypothetical protein